MTSASLVLEGDPKLAACSLQCRHIAFSGIHRLGTGQSKLNVDLKGREKMQSDKLSKNAPAHSTNAPQPATDIPHEDVSKKQSDAQKSSPVSTQVKQGDAVTLTQVDMCTSRSQHAGFCA